MRRRNNQQHLILLRCWTIQIWKITNFKIKIEKVYFDYLNTYHNSLCFVGHRIEEQVLTPANGLRRVGVGVDFHVKPELHVPNHLVLHFGIFHTDQNYRQSD